MIDVFLRCCAKYDYIVEVDEGKLPIYAEQDHVQGLLESARCVVETKWHTYKAIGDRDGIEHSLISLYVIKLGLQIYTISTCVGTTVASLRACMHSSMHNIS